MDSERTKGPDETLASAMRNSDLTSNKLVCLIVMGADAAVNFQGCESHIAYGVRVVILPNDGTTPAVLQYAVESDIPHKAQLLPN